MRASILLLVLITALGAAEVGGVLFEDRLVLHGSGVPLRGTAVQKWKVLWTVHATAWWQDPATEVQADTPKALELHYFHDIPAEGFRTATSEGFARGCTRVELAALQERLDLWNAAYIDIAAGARYRISYHPERGTSLGTADRILITVPGADFAIAIFGIWLGPKPVEANHRRDLLDGR